MTKAEQFCKLNGIEWHEIKYNFFDNTMTCSCGVEIDIVTLSVGLHKTNTFTDAKSILEVMDRRPNGKLFYARLMYGEHDNVEAIDDTGYIDRDYILNSDKLLDEAIQFCKKVR